MSGSSASRNEANFQERIKKKRIKAKSGELYNKSL